MKAVQVEEQLLEQEMRQLQQNRGQLLLQLLPVLNQKKYPLKYQKQKVKLIQS